MSDTIINTGTQIPEYERKKTFEKIQPGQETTTEATMQSPERVAADQAEGAVAGQAEDVAQREKALGASQASLEEDAALERVRTLDAQQAAHDRAAAEASADIARYRERTQKRQAELDAYDSPSLFGNTDTHGKVIRGLAMAAGAVGDAIQKAAMVRIGKAPPTIDTVGEIIERTLNEQKDHISKLKDAVVMARTGEADAQEARRQMLADVDLRGAAMYKRSEALVAARLAAMGKTQAEIDADKNIVALREKRAEKHAAYVAPLLDKVTTKVETATIKSGSEDVNRAPTVTGGKPTESQAKTAGLAAGMADEIATIEKLPQLTPEALAKLQDNQLASSAADSAAEKGAVGNVGARVARAVGAAPRSRYEGLTPEQQRAANAWDNLVELRARQLTGAGMPEEEARREARSLGVYPGDTPAMVKQKLERLKAAARDQAALGGPATEQIKTARATPAAETPSGARDVAIKLVRERPSAPGSRLLRKKFNITDAELSP